MQIRRTLVLTAVGTTAMFAFAACGADQSPASTSSPVSAGANSTGQRIDPAQFINSLVSAIDKQTSVHLSVMADSMGTGQADVSYSSKKTMTKVAAVLNPGGPRNFIVTGGAVYMLQPTSGKYLMLDKADPTYGSLIASFTQLAPSAAVAGLGNGVTAVVSDGTTVISGVRLKRFKVTADPRKATGAFKVLAGSSSAAQPMTFEFDVDGRGLLCHLSVTLSGQKSSVSLTKWGVPVRISIPRSNQLIHSVA
jgi:hypothetical protein